jgi:hypothetical protein
VHCAEVAHTSIVSSPQFSVLVAQQTNVGSPQSAVKAHISMQTLSVHVAVPMHWLPVQHAAPGVPHAIAAVQTPAVQVNVLSLHMLPVQHAWPIAPHCATGAVHPNHGEPSAALLQQSIP